MPTILDSSVISGNSGGGGNLGNTVIFTSSGTFDPAAYGVSGKLITVMCIGGGGGSHSSAIVTGYPGDTAFWTGTVTGAVTVTVGDGGSGLSDGGASSFGAYATAAGGKNSGTLYGSPDMSYIASCGAFPNLAPARGFGAAQFSGGSGGGAKPATSGAVIIFL